MEDWMLPTPSPRTLMSSFLNEEFSCGPFSGIVGENATNKPQDGLEKSKAFVDLSKEETAQAMKASLQFESNLFDANQKSGSHGGLAERMAARAGFRVLQIDTSRVSSSAPIWSPVAIPPGVSPRELLESPVFLPNAIAQPSPTTGKLPFSMSTNVKSTISSVPKKVEDRLRNDCAFSFQPILRSKQPSLSIAVKGFSVVHQNQYTANDNQQGSSLQSDSTATKDVMETNIVKPKTSYSMLDNDHPSPADEQDESEENQNGDYSSAPIIAPAEDGYNWRKYGQKQVKNSEYPRSYYKCTHPNCPVKKKVECSQDGHITEIIYKCSHNHPLLPTNHRPNVLLSHFHVLKADSLEDFSSKSELHTTTSWDNAPNGNLQDGHSEVLETKLSTSFTTTELTDTSVMEPREAIDVPSTLSNEEDDTATHGTVSLGCDGDEDGTESKRRKMDISATNTATTSTIDMGSLSSRAVREPRVIVQTTSEVDILDDGYRWRKYGQKVVKGNPNPRSYYKCTHPGCSVRKHVERASHDLKSVITTYEGKHNHEVPAARNSGHPSSSLGIAPPAAPQTNGLYRRPEPAQGILAQFGSIAASRSTGIPPRDQLVAAAGSFSFGLLPHGTAVPMLSLGTVVPAQGAGHPPAMQGYSRLVLPAMEVRVNPGALPGLPLANGTARTAYQLMGRPSQDPQM